MKEKYETIELPSKGECYPDKIREVHVKPLTASDENIITSPFYNINGTMSSILLRNKITDSNVDCDSLISVDRGYILLWLRRNGYGDEYRYKDDEGNERTVDLSKVKFDDFTLKGDKNGFFGLTTEKGDAIKYRIVNYRQEIILNNSISLINKEAENKKDITDIEYYMMISGEILKHLIVTVNGKKYFKKWLKNLDFGYCRHILKQIQDGMPKSDTLGLNLNEGLFNDLVDIN